jgi:D-aminoacyl-tRNA deacylase
MTMVNYLRDNKGFSTYDDNNNDSLKSKVYKNVELYISTKSPLYLEDLDERYPHSKAFIFLSRHRSESGIPTLTCHCTGNYGVDDQYGGNPREIAISYPYLQKQFLKRITNVRSSIPGYDIVVEASHHGPTSLKKPILFTEIGSTERQWLDRNAASVICDCMLDIIANGLEEHCEKVGIGLGGTHYPIKFNKLLLQTEFGLAAVAARHNLESIDEKMLHQMIVKSVEKVTHIIVDWKGLGKEKNRIMRLVENTGLNVLKV